MDLHHLLLAGLPAHSAVPPTADIVGQRGHVRKVPMGDIAGCAQYERGRQLRRPYFRTTWRPCSRVISRYRSIWPASLAQVEERFLRTSTSLSFSANFIKRRHSADRSRQCCALSRQCCALSIPPYASQYLKKSMSHNYYPPGITSPRIYHMGTPKLPVRPRTRGGKFTAR
jgi:hypothetical protein